MPPNSCGRQFDLSNRLTRYRPRPLQLVIIPVEETRALQARIRRLPGTPRGDPHLAASVTPRPTAVPSRSPNRGHATDYRSANTGLISPRAVAACPKR
jgi:hypothetical protein